MGDHFLQLVDTTLVCVIQFLHLTVTLLPFLPIVSFGLSISSSLYLISFALREWAPRSRLVMVFVRHFGNSFWRLDGVSAEWNIECLGSLFLEGEIWSIMECMCERINQVDFWRQMFVWDLCSSKTTSDGLDEQEKVEDVLCNGGWACVIC